MKTLKRRPTAKPTCDVAHSAPHQTLVCKTRRHRRTTCPPGFVSLNKLSAVFVTARDRLPRLCACTFARMIVTGAGDAQ